MSLFSFLKKKNKRALGIQVVGRSLRWAEVDILDQAFDVRTHGMLDTKYDLWRESIQNQDQVMDDLAPLAAYRDTPLACVLPSSLTQTAYLSIPIIDLSQKNIPNAIKNYIESYVVEHQRFVTSDTMCLYDVLSQNNERVEIVATFYKSSDVQGLSDIFHALGFATVHFTPMQDALQALHSTDDPALLLSVTDHTTAVLQVENGYLTGFGETAFGGGSVMNIIRDVVGDERAPRVYARYGMKSSHRDPKVYADIVKQAMPIIDLAQHMIADTDQDHDIILAGDHAQLPGLDTFIAQYLRRVPQTLDVWQRFVSPDVRLPVIDAHDMLRFAPSLGAAVDYLESR